jgi:hypothetical protein
MQPTSSSIPFSTPFSDPFSEPSSSQRHYSAHDLLEGLSVDEIDDFLDQADSHHVPYTIPYNFPPNFLSNIPRTRECLDLRDLEQDGEEGGEIGEEDYKEEVIDEEDYKEEVIDSSTEDDVEEELKWLSLSDSSDSSEYQAIPQPKWETRNGRLSPQSFAEIVKFIEDSKKEVKNTKELLERKEQADKQGGV